MTTLRKILAANMRAYRNELGLSQSKLADKVNTATNYIAMIECEKRFPTDTMLERIAIALEREPFELFSITPVKQGWQEELLSDLSQFISDRLRDVEGKKPCEFISNL
jgi:transcriptional regulator with XRE-family HTH domain